MSLLQKTCLKPSYSLRTQLLLSFGISSFLCLATVVALACTAAFLSGQTVKDQADALMREQVHENLLSASKVVGQEFDAYLIELEGTVQLIVEVVRDRIVGYPYPGWEEDKYVPFFDMDTQTNMYPLAHPPPPMEWNVTSNFVIRSIDEHTPERERWLASFPSVSTATGAYFIQGACDPSQTNASARTYYQNCTDENNDNEYGGKVNPTRTNRGLHQKSGDLVVVLKALWETQSDALTVGVYFHNSGAGSHVVFPGYNFPGPEQPPYVSEGCEWMLDINPFIGRPYATQDEVARCHPKGTLVPQREYNAMERMWCQSFIRSPKSFGWYGPYRSYDHGAVILTVGKAIHDRQTGELIGCVGVDISIHDLSAHMKSVIVDDHSELLLVTYDEGTVVSDSRFTNVLVEDDETLNIEQLGVLSLDSFKTVREIVDFESYWDPIKAVEAFQSIIQVKDGGLMTAYPIPVIPDKYNAMYRPRFMLLYCISMEVFGIVEYIGDSIDDDLVQIATITSAVALFGIILVLLVVWFVSRMLTEPLLWMESVAWRIINHTDKRLVDQVLLGDEEEILPNIRCAPRTEVSELVREFRIMIKGFSGKGASKIAESCLNEIPNDLTWHSDFQQLYIPPHRAQKRTSQSFTASSDLTDDESSSRSYGFPTGGILNRPGHEMLKEEDGISTTVVPAPVKQNRCRVIRCTGSYPTRNDSAKQPVPRKIRHQSQLFWWIIVLIVLPILMLVGFTCICVSVHVSTTFPSWLMQAGDSSQSLALNALLLTSKAKASLMKYVVFESVRDLHLVTRVAGWLLFGGVQRSAAFTSLESACDECKEYPRDSCPFLNSTRATCSCIWGDSQSHSCMTLNLSESRNVQQQFWGLQSQDADMRTGNRNQSSSFPNVGNAPNETEWWGDVSELPGAVKGEQAEGYTTSYDRIRVSSALSVVTFPVYNYGYDLAKDNQNRGVYVNFNDDGLVTGFDGCQHNHVDFPFFVSSEANKATSFAPDLCPIGKYGYDPRCTEWFFNGSDQYKKMQVPIYISAPYHATDDNFAVHATAPLANPRTGEYVGQTLLNFVPQGVRRALEQLGDLNSFILTSTVDTSSGDIIITSNDTASGLRPASISDLLFDPSIASDFGYRQEFENYTLAKINNGSTGVKSILSSKVDGSIAFAPVWENVLLPISPDNFSAGVTASQVLLYSVCIFSNASYVRSRFQKVENDIKNQLENIMVVYVLVTLLVAFLFSSFACVMSMCIATPMMNLLLLVKNANRQSEQSNLPPLKGGCREVHRVYSTFAKLYKIVKASNTAFFTSNLKWAFHFINDALQLFRKIDDRKAIGIACNNLGNTLFAMYYDGMECSAIDGFSQGLIASALQHYEESIQLGEEDFENTPSNQLKADYAFQLADRLFNRGLFLLLIQDAEEAPDNARQLAFQDICRTKNLDHDTREYLLSNKLLLKKSADCFTRLLRRINGLADFYDDMGLRNIWNIEELIHDADQLLLAAWCNPNAPIFSDVNRVGRLQQLEAAAILMWQRMDCRIEAARLAMRMLVEDSFILEESFVRAATAVLELLRSENQDVSFSNKTLSGTLEDFRRMRKCCKNIAFDIGKCLVFAVELSETWEGDPLLEKISTNCLALYDRHCSAFDYMGVAAHGIAENFTLELGRKEGNEGRQRTLLDLATSTTSRCADPAFPLAMQLLVDSQASVDNDSYIVLILDGYAWDENACSPLRLQIERLNRERNTSIHLFMVGLDVEDERVRDQCRELSNVSKLSLYADATLENVECIFEKIIDLMVGGPVKDGLLRGITMEHF